MIDMEYAKGFFDVWCAGLTDAELWEAVGVSANHGFSAEICISKARIKS